MRSVRARHSRAGAWAGLAREGGRSVRRAARAGCLCRAARVHGAGTHMGRDERDVSFTSFSRLL
eukprot:167409-Chlamydomonas_euryale.AAC.1